MPIFTSEGDLDCKRSLNQLPFQRKKTLRKKVVVVKDTNEEDDKVGKNWVDGEVLHLIVLKGEMEFKFAQNAKKRKKKLNFVFVLDFFFFNFQSLVVHVNII